VSTEDVIDTPRQDDNRKPRPGTVSVLLGLILAFANSVLAYMVAEAKVPQESAYFDVYAAAYVLRTIVLWQLIVIALFSIDRRFRNLRSAARIYCWTSLAVFFGTMMQIAVMLPG